MRRTLVVPLIAVVGLVAAGCGIPPPPLPTAADVAGCYDRAEINGLEYNDVELEEFDLGVPGVEGGIVNDGWFSFDGTCTDGGFGSNKFWLIAADLSSAQADCDAAIHPGSPLQAAQGWGLALDYVFICG